MRLVAFAAVLMLFPLAAAAGQKPAAQTAQPEPSAVERRADAYANFILGHVSQLQFEDTGKQEYADQAIAFFKKAQALDPDTVAIPLKLAQTYAEAQRLRDAVETAQAILKAHPDNLETHQLLARIYVRSLGELGSNASQQHTLALAVEQYEAVLKLDPANNEAGLWLARLYRFQNQPDKAAKVLEQLLRSDPSNERALTQYTQLLLDEGHADQAIARLSKVTGEEDSARLYDLLGDAYARTHQTAPAVEAYRKATELEPGVPSHWRRLARALFQDNQFGEAAKAYQQLTSLDPSDPDNFLQLAESYYQLKQYDHARASIEQAKQLAPDNLEVIYNEALIANAQGRYDDAISVITAAISHLKRQASTQSTSPGVYSILYLELIESYRDNNQIDLAISTARQAMATDPKNRQIKIAYALMLGEKQETDEAVKTLRGLLSGTAADREIYLDIAQVEQRGRRYADAEKDARVAESMATKPKDKAAAWFLMGAIYERQKKYSQAEPLFRKALAVNPHDAPVLNYYGYMLTEQGIRLDQAAELVKRALVEDANNSAYLDSLGWTYYKQNRLVDAREYLLKAVARSPHDPTILGHLGDVYDRLGETNLAIATWEKSLAEWRRAVPADYEADQVREVERKLERAKGRSARRNHTSANQPH